MQNENKKKMSAGDFFHLSKNMHVVRRTVAKMVQTKLHMQKITCQCLTVHCPGGVEVMAQ